MQDKSITNDRSVNIIIILIVVLSIACAVLSFLIKPIIMLNENQILYIFSTAAQVVAGLYGLTLAGYIFVESKLNERVEEDKTLFDQIETLKSQYYSLIQIIGVLCILSILFCLLNIGIYKVVTINNLHTYILNQTILFVIFEVVLIVLFSWYVINPNNITKISDRLKRLAERHLDKETDYSPNQKGDLSEFLKYYNMLEELIVSYANELIAKNGNMTWKYQKEFKPQIMQSLKILNAHEIINENMYNEINELRKYRNFTVHGTDFTVDSRTCDRLRQIYKALNKVYEVRLDDEKRIAAISDLYKISK